jgi:hypothetical protein
MIENTSNRDPLLHLLGAMSDGTDTYITDMEAAGQRQLVHSDRLPSKGPIDEMEKLGFTFGDIDRNDPLFRPATLPDGWKKQGSDHDMWSHVIDPLGRKRVAIFYKAAFYDRDAFMRLETVSGYLYNLAYEGGSPVLDHEWCTAEAVAEAARDYIKRERETVELYTRPDVVDREPKYAAERLAEANKHIAWAEALIAKVGA